MQSNRLLIIGRKPLPIGGVTIHVSRLCEWLEHYGISFYFLDPRNAGIIKLLYAIYLHKIMHVHTTNPYFGLLTAVCANMLKTECLLTLHGDLFRYTGLSGIIMRQALKIVTVPILLNVNSYDAVRKFNKDARLISSFLPPLTTEHLDQSITQEIASRSTGKLLTCASNAFDLVFDKDGSELYGITNIIDTLMDKNCFLIISDPSGKYIKFVRSKYSDVQLKNVLFISKPHSFHSVLALVEIFIRNTTTDGDSISIHEALYLGKQVWATDCVMRPDGVNVYSKLDEMFNEQICAQPYVPPNTMDELISLY